MDAGDSMLQGCAQPILRFFGFVSAVWLGGIIAGASLGMGDLVIDPLANWSRPLRYMALGPLFLLSGWFFLNLVIVIGGLGWYVRTERNLPKFWASLVTVCAILGVAGSIKSAWFSPWQTVATWLTLAILIAVLVAAVAFVIQWQRNRWAVEMAMLQAENAQRRAEVESRGIATFDPERWE